MNANSRNLFCQPYIRNDNLDSPGQLIWVLVQKIPPAQTFDSTPSPSLNDSALFALQSARLVLYWIHLVILENDSLEPYTWMERQ